MKRGVRLPPPHTPPLLVCHRCPCLPAATLSTCSAAPTAAAAAAAAGAPHAPHQEKGGCLAQGAEGAEPVQLRPTPRGRAGGRPLQGMGRGTLGLGWDVGLGSTTCSRFGFSNKYKPRSHAKRSNPASGGMAGLPLPCVDAPGGPVVCWERPRPQVTANGRPPHSPAHAHVCLCVYVRACFMGAYRCV